MRISLLLLFMASFFCGISQDSTPIKNVDTLLPFFGNLPIRLHGYENRVVPFNSVYPLYVQITYENSKAKHFEYFRMDSSTYLVLQFFRSAKGSSNEGLKSSGVVKVVNNILDSSFINSRSASGEGNSIQVEYYKGFSKEGEWEEYEDSLFHHKFWIGNYANNKKVGIWSNYIYDPNGDPLIMQIDFDKDSTSKLFTVNLVGNATLDSIKYVLNGRWLLGCEDDKDRRMLMSKCQLYDGHYGDDCNNRFGKENYYEFLSNGSFKRQKGETCDKFKQNVSAGKWTISRSKDNLFLEIRLANNAAIKYKVWYLDREGNMVADRL